MRLADNIIERLLYAIAHIGDLLGRFGRERAKMRIEGENCVHKRDFLIFKIKCAKRLDKLVERPIDDSIREMAAINILNNQPSMLTYYGSSMPRAPLPRSK